MSTDVLADPSGRRRRVLRLLGCLVAIAFVLWFLGLAVAGLDLIPAQTGLLGRPLLGQHPPTLQASSAPAHGDSSVKSR